MSENTVHALLLEMREYGERTRKYLDELHYQRGLADGYREGWRDGFHEGRKQVGDHIRDSLRFVLHDREEVVK